MTPSPFLARVRSHARTGAVALLVTSGVPAQLQEVVDTYIDGSIRARYTIDAEGRRTGTYTRYFRGGQVKERFTYQTGVKSGPFQEYFADGARKTIGAYKADKLHGEHKEFDAAGNRVVTTHFAEGVKHGAFLVVERGKTLTKQVWNKGQLATLDGIAPFPRSASEIQRQLARILAAPKSVAGAESDPQLPRRLEALRRLKAYRYLCSLPFEDMQLKPEWNTLCDYGARLCQAIGRLDHTPKKPAGMADDDYRKGYQATSHSNLSMGSGMVRSVDAYMNDSDPRNIERVGHRRWCLNPGMKFTGFGEAGRFSAMWSFDQSGGGARGLDAVLYPPPGYVPVGYFGARHAWSISIIRGRQAKKQDARIRIVALDEFYLPAGKPLEIDFLNAQNGGPGIANCLIFRPSGLVVEAGRRYWCEVSLDAGKTLAYRYLVEFL